MLLQTGVRYAIVCHFWSSCRISHLRQLCVVETALAWGPEGLASRDGSDVTSIWHHFPGPQGHCYFLLIK